MPSPTQRQGFKIEQGAARFLESNGLQPLTRNFNSRFGELDLVMWDDNVLVIVEVRHRSAGSLVSAIESVTPSKRQRIIRATQRLITRDHSLQQHPIRFDVVAVDGDPERPSFDWIRDAFRPW